MSFTQTQLDVLDAAIASGTLRVVYDGKETTYRSMAEMLTARRIVARDLAVSSGTDQPRFVNPIFDRGV